MCFYWESDPAVCSDPRTPQDASRASKFDLLEVCRGAVSQPCPRTLVIIKNACLQASLVSNQNYLCNTKTVAERVGTFGDCHTYHGTTCCNSCVWPQLVTTIQITWKTAFRRSASRVPNMPRFPPCFTVGVQNSKIIRISLKQLKQFKNHIFVRAPCRWTCSGGRRSGTRSSRRDSFVGTRSRRCGGLASALPSLLAHFSTTPPFLIISGSLTFWIFLSYSYEYCLFGVKKYFLYFHFSCLEWRSIER